MYDLFTRALAGDVEALGGAASIITICAILPAAIVFVVNQTLENSRLREDKYRFLHEQYIDYLKMCLSYPEFGLEQWTSGSYRELQPLPKQQLSIIFEIYTSMVESAFKAYQKSFTSSRKTQWIGWVDYLDRYLDRQDYFEYIIDWLYCGNVSMSDGGIFEVSRAGISQYDTEFDQFLLERLRLAWGRRGVQSSEPSTTGMVSN